MAETNSIMKRVFVFLLMILCVHSQKLECQRAFGCYMHKHCERDHEMCISVGEERIVYISSYVKVLVSESENPPNTRILTATHTQCEALATLYTGWNIYYKSKKCIGREFENESSEIKTTRTARTVPATKITTTEESNRYASTTHESDRYLTRTESTQTENPLIIVNTVGIVVIIIIPLSGVFIMIVIRARRRIRNARIKMDSFEMTPPHVPRYKLPDTTSSPFSISSSCPAIFHAPSSSSLSSLEFEAVASRTRQETAKKQLYVK